MKTTSILSLLALLPAALPAAEEEVLTSEQTKFFETKIRPALVEYCYKCHSADEKIKGGLSLDTKAGIRHGGDTGPAVVPGDLDESWLWISINWADDDYEMPPKKKMPAAVIADFKTWIEMGAPDPRVAEKMTVETEIDIEKGKDFWSFVKPLEAPLPAVKDREWPASGVDRFILAKLEEHGLTPAEEASAEVLLRRLYFDLVGIPPSLEEVERYAKAWRKDPEQAYAGKVDELLASPRFGEKWGRNWLDVARYAESTGREINMTYPHAWRYRDYVIDSFNEDKPYDRFIKEQIAGDLLPIKGDEDWQENLVATGFLAVGTKGLNERNPRQFALDVADEQIDATSQAFLGLTVACARCHDHKSDPIPTADYYSMSGIFLSTKTFFGTLNVIVNRRGTRLLELPIPDADAKQKLSSREIAGLKQRLATAEEQLQDIQEELRRARQGGGQPANIQQILRLRSQIALMKGQLNGVDESGRAKTYAMGAQDRDSPVDPVVLVRGELDKPAQEVARGFVQVIDHRENPINLPTATSGRLELAEWIASEDNPLTARVMVNRIWQQLFGRAIVDTPNNFGATGQEPTHPELLDTLAVRFMADDWSMKSFIRGLVMTKTYRMSSKFSATAYEIDPDNKFRWRASPRSLSAEALRDAMLAASGELDLERPQGSLVADIGDAAIGQRLSPDALNRTVLYRSIFLPAARDALPESLALFDPADPNLVHGKRDTTNVPGQALYLMNNPFVVERADAMARRIAKMSETPQEHFENAFKLAYGRLATKGEVKGSMTFFHNFKTTARKEGLTDEQTNNLAFATFCQALLVSAEFRFLN